MYKKEKIEFFRKLNLSFVTDNKNCWKVVKPLFTEKGCVGDNNIILSEKTNLFMFLRYKIVILVTLFQRWILEKIHASEKKYQPK